ncbi:MAG: 2-phospho-L-lactate transferase [Gammaproteobacteria bacterium]|nr:2-phospho-L-lactate transferase [Gammaproteobacteria bacterium]
MNSSQKPVKGRPKYIVLTGGVGGAKLCQGLARVLEPSQLLFVVNTGDDFTHLGLHISPDVDSLMYALAGLSSRERGWGRDDETWNCLETLKKLGGESWFRLGDRDLALHLKRTADLAAGKTLTQSIASIKKGLRVKNHIVPMSNDPVRTKIDTDEGMLSFQEYFVSRQCQPKVNRVVYQGTWDARMASSVHTFLQSAELRGTIICPSNPVLSIDPILEVEGMRDWLRFPHTPRVAVSPIIGGEAVKGPTAKIFKELGKEVNAIGVAKHYGTLLDGFIYDRRDHYLETRFKGMPLPARSTETLMQADADKEALARNVLQFIDDISLENVFGKLEPYDA